MHIQRFSGVSSLAPALSPKKPVAFGTLSPTRDTVKFSGRPIHLDTPMDADSMADGEHLSSRVYVRARDSADIGSIRAGEYVEVDNSVVNGDVVSERSGIEFRDSDCHGTLRAEHGGILVEGSDKIGGVVTGMDTKLFRIADLTGDVRAKTGVETDDIVSRGNITTSGGNIVFRKGECAGQLRAERGNVTAENVDRLGSVYAGGNAQLTRIKALTGNVEAKGTVSIDDSGAVGGKVKGQQGVSIHGTDIGNLNLEEPGSDDENADFNTGRPPLETKVESGGRLKLTNAGVAGNAKAKGNVELNNAYIEGELTTDGNRVTITNESEVGQVTVNAPGQAPGTTTLTEPEKPGFNLFHLFGHKEQSQPIQVDTRPVVTIKSGSVVHKDIVFMQGEGLVKVEDGAGFEGEVIGGTVEEAQSS